MSEEKKPSPGQPTKYDPKYCDMIIDYFGVEHFENNRGKVKGAELPQFTAFARSIGVSRSTLHKWTQDHKEFSDAYNTAKQLQEELIANNAINGRYNPVFSQFMLKNCHNWKDRQEVEQTVQQIQISKEDEQL